MRKTIYNIFCIVNLIIAVIAVFKDNYAWATLHSVLAFYADWKSEQGK